MKRLSGTISTAEGTKRWLLSGLSIEQKKIVKAQLRKACELLKKQNGRLSTSDIMYIMS